MQNTGVCSPVDILLYDDVKLCCDIYDWMRRLLAVVMDTAQHIGKWTDEDAASW